MPFTVVSLNVKGGVGKTTAAINLFGTSVCADYSSGILDIDRQGNSTAWCLSRRGFEALPAGFGAEAFAVTQARKEPAVFVTNKPEDQLVPVERTGGGFVIPANPYVSPSDWSDLRLDLVPVDLLVVDCPPSLPWALVRRLIAQANFVVAPIQPEAMVVQVVPDLVQQVVEAGRSEMLQAGTFKLLMNAVQKNAGHRAWESVLRNQFPELLAETVWPRAAGFTTASEEFGNYSRKAKPAKLAAELWEEIFANTKTKGAAA